LNLLDCSDTWNAGQLVFSGCLGGRPGHFHHLSQAAIFLSVTDSIADATGFSGVHLNINTIRVRINKVKAMEQIPKKEQTFMPHLPHRLILL
jgi:hypothetical protein